jgi:uncharacterized protein YqhQ
MKNFIMLVMIAALIMFLVVAGPLAIIWALNVLFPVLAIPYNVWTWLAALILSTVVKTSVKLKK